MKGLHVFSEFRFVELVQDPKEFLCIDLLSGFFKKLEPQTPNPFSHYYLDFEFCI